MTPTEPTETEQTNDGPQDAPTDAETAESRQDSGPEQTSDSGSDHTLPHQDGATPNAGDGNGSNGSE